MSRPYLFWTIICPPDCGVITGINTGLFRWFGSIRPIPHFKYIVKEFIGFVGYQEWIIHVVIWKWQKMRILNPLNFMSIYYVIHSGWHVSLMDFPFLSDTDRLACHVTYHRELTNSASMVGSISEGIAENKGHLLGPIRTFKMIGSGITSNLWR